MTTQEKSNFWSEYTSNIFTPLATAFNTATGGSVAMTTTTTANSNACTITAAVGSASGFAIFKPILEKTLKSVNKYSSITSVRDVVFTREPDWEITVVLSFNNIDEEIMFDAKALAFPYVTFNVDPDKTEPVAKDGGNICLEVKANTAWVVQDGSSPAFVTFKDDPVRGTSFSGATPTYGNINKRFYAIVAPNTTNAPRDILIQVSDADSLTTFNTYIFKQK